MSSAMKIVVTLLVVVALAGCGVPKEKHTELQEQYAKVKENIANFNAEVQKIRLENLDLKKQVKDFQTQVAKLEAENKQWEERFQKLNEEKSAVEAPVQSATEGTTGQAQ